MDGLNWTLCGHLPRLYEMVNEMRDVERAMENSLYDVSPYKYVISPEGSQLLRTLTFDDTIEQKECYISLEPFVAGEAIMELPCKHLFKKQEIEYWLSNKKAQCPVCRHELPSMRVPNDEQNEPTPISQEMLIDNDRDIIRERQNLADSLRTMSLSNMLPYPNWRSNT